MENRAYGDDPCKTAAVDSSGLARSWHPCSSPGLEHGLEQAGQSLSERMKSWVRNWKQLEEVLKVQNEDERIVMGLDFLVFADEQPLLAQQVSFSLSQASQQVQGFCSITFFLVADFFCQSQLIRNPFQFFKKMREALPPLAKRVWIRPFNLLPGLQSSGEQRTSG